MALYMSVTTIGPIVGPIISGASSSVSWRWPFWIATLIAIAGLPLVLALPETYSPVLYNKAIRKLLKQNAPKFDIAAGQHPQVLDSRLQAPELKPFNAREIFLRPLNLLVTEPILFFTSAYLTMGYAVFYLMFQAYPQVFQRFYRLRPGIAALAYLPMIVGVIGSLAIFAAFTSYHDRRTRAGASWTEKEIYRRLPLACIASPFRPVLVGLDCVGIDSPSGASDEWRLLCLWFPIAFHGDGKLFDRRISTKFGFSTRCCKHDEVDRSYPAATVG
ncbi:hypothetical protein BN1723_015749 [Verticillium longisporum]|uniref:Major facilitator superfamily (MFS) profile domain-containing protein n=1 Tax=Verticillium longisporum TaxID=100787 RepID=A0A0G4N2F1_VERLO|nr:hypothetical protein BN1708_015934 [Verticillium longisporum]CRK40495.1 hypothetical protein BN1723_015749 [Verticillium longisporum]